MYVAVIQPIGRLLRACVQERGKSGTDAADHDPRVVTLSGSAARPDISHINLLPNRLSMCSSGERHAQDFTACLLTLAAACSFSSTSFRNMYVVSVCQDRKYPFITVSIRRLHWARLSLVASVSGWHGRFRLSLIEELSQCYRLPLRRGGL